MALIIAFVPLLMPLGGIFSKFAEVTIVFTFFLELAVVFVKTHMVH